MATSESLDEEQEAFLFDVRRSIRYHDRRKAFFTLLHKITSLMTILMAGSILYVAQSNETGYFLVLFSAFGAFIAGLDVLVNFSGTANLYNDLKSRFIRLEVDIICPSDVLDWESCKRTRLMIESDEPPTYHALNLLCHNELVIAMGLGRNHLYKIGYVEKYTSHLWQWHNIGEHMEKLYPESS